VRNIKLTIEYDGTNYCGWQVQSRNRRKKSVQGTIEKALGKILQQDVKLIASGRTDAGVHALAQVANFKTNLRIPLDNIQKALNTFLPDDIAIVAIEEVALNFHSRFAARSKVYRYTILNRKSPSALLRNRAYFYPYQLNIDSMRKAARVLIGKHNFKAFQKTDSSSLQATPEGASEAISFRLLRTSSSQPSGLLRRPDFVGTPGNDGFSSVRTISKINISKRGGLLYINIEADGFLYSMARSIVGTLLEIGRGKFPVHSLGKILVSGNRKLAGPTAPACGLCLIKVKY